MVPEQERKKQQQQKQEQEQKQRPVSEVRRHQAKRNWVIPCLTSNHIHCLISLIFFFFEKKSPIYFKFSSRTWKFPTRVFYFTLTITDVIILTKPKAHDSSTRVRSSFFGDTYGLCGSWRRSPNCQQSEPQWI